MTLLRGSVLQTTGLAVYLTGVGFHPRQVGIRVFARGNRMLLVQHAGNFEEGAGVLRDHVRRVAPRPARVEQRDVTIGKREPFQRELVRGAHHVHVDTRGAAQSGRVDGLQVLEPLRDPLRDEASAPPPSGPTTST